MTVLLRGGEAKEYIGLSSDDKPMNVAEGSTYHSVDTGEHWVFHDLMWEMDLTNTRAMQIALEL